MATAPLDAGGAIAILERLALAMAEPSAPGPNLLVESELGDMIVNETLMSREQMVVVVVQAAAFAVTIALDRCTTNQVPTFGDWIDIRQRLVDEFDGYRKRWLPPLDPFLQDPQ